MQKKKVSYQSRRFGWCRNNSSPAHVLPCWMFARERALLSGDTGQQGQRAIALGSWGFWRCGFRTPAGDGSCPTDRIPSPARPRADRVHRNNNYYYYCSPSRSRSRPSPTTSIVFRTLSSHCIGRSPIPLPLCFCCCCVAWYARLTLANSADICSASVISPCCCFWSSPVLAFFFSGVVCCWRLTLAGRGHV